MKRIYRPTEGTNSWKALLSEPDKHWRPGFSAMTLASCWEAANGLPAEIEALFADHGSPELLLGLVEHKVPLPGSNRGDSQSDLFALIRAGDRTFATTVEGKVAEPFDKPLRQWLVAASNGRRQRLEYISGLLGLQRPVPGDVYYQLLHRTAAAVIEAQRFKTDAACMVVHSFSPTRQWYDAFARFAELLGVPAATDRLLPVNSATGSRFGEWLDS